MNALQDLFDRQKRLFATGATRSYTGRIEPNGVKLLQIHVAYHLRQFAA